MNACIEQAVTDKSVEIDSIGFVDAIDNGVICGWVISKDDKPIEIDVFIDGGLCAVTVKWVERYDVAEHYGKDVGACGFLITPCTPEVDFGALFLDKSKSIDIFVNKERIEWNCVNSHAHVDGPSYLEHKSLLDFHVDYLKDFSIKGWAISEDFSVCDIKVLVNESELYCASYSVKRVDVARVYGKRAINSGFEIYLPGSMWEKADESGICEITVLANGIAVTPEPIILEAGDVARWIDRLCELEDCEEAEFLGLLALEHVKYSGSIDTLPERSCRFLGEFAKKVHLENFLMFDNKETAGVADEKTESISSIMLREAMYELNDLIEGGSQEIFPIIRKVYKKYSLRGPAKEWYLNLAVQLTCASGEFDKLSELTDFNYLEGLQSSQQPHQLALLLPVLVSNGEFEKATEIMRQISKHIENSWLPTECLLYAVKAVNNLEMEGRVDISVAERFRGSFVALLDGFKAGWFSRLHDEQLVSGMVTLLAKTEFYTDYHKRYLAASAIRHYGLSPTFWRKLGEFGVCSEVGELKKAKQAWNVLVCYLGDCDDVSPSKAVKVLEALDYFASKGNSEVDNIVREMALNGMRSTEVINTNLRASLIQKLFTRDYPESLRVIAYPESRLNEIVDDACVNDNDIMHGIRGLGDYRKSAVYDMQHDVSEAIGVLRQMTYVLDGDGRKRFVDKYLSDIEKKSALLGTWQGMFIGVDMLISAYQMGVAIGGRKTSLLMNAMEMIQVAVRECSVHHAVAAPICAAISRINALSTNDLHFESMVGDVKKVLIPKFGERYRGLFETIDSRGAIGDGFGWPQDTLVVIHTTRTELDGRCQEIRDTWIKDLIRRQIPYLFVVGGGEDGVNLEGDILEVDIPEERTFSVQKTLKTYEWLLENKRFQYLVTVDDKCFLGIDAYFNSLSYRKYHYYGKIMRCSHAKIDRQWHKDLVEAGDGGKDLDKSSAKSSYVNGYFATSMSAFAVRELCEVSKTQRGMWILNKSYSADKVVGELLSEVNITPSDEDFDVYSDTPILHELVPDERHGNGFVPGSLSPSKIARITNKTSGYKDCDKLSGFSIWPKRIWPTYQKPSLKPNSNMLELLSNVDKLHQLLREYVVVVCVVRNEMVMLPQFLSHYRGLGIKCFIFIDNCSDDGTREYLLSQNDTIVYSADTEYKCSHYGVAWQQAVLGNHCLGKWVLLADADEFLVFDKSESTSLPAVVKGFDNDKDNAALTYMIDMYPYGELDQARFDENHVFDVAPYFDKRALIELKFGGGMYSNSRNFVNGLRHRLAPSRINAYVSQKYALFKYYPWVRLCEGVHYSANMQVSDNPVFFAHFKYHSGFKEKVALEVRRKQHYNNAEEYHKYASMITEMSGGFGEEGVSERYVDSQSFVRLAKELKG